MLINNFNIQEENKTKIIAEEISKICKKGDVLAISGSMGVGKTTFIKYFIQKITKAKSVPSPSYNIYFKYNSQKAEIYHMDAWRISSELEIFNLGVLDFFQDSIFLIEWANKIDTYLPVSKLSITLEFSKTYRTISFRGDKKWKKRLDKDFKRNFLEN